MAPHIKIWIFLIGLSAFSVIIFLSFPQIDIAASTLFFSPPAAFPLAENLFLIVLRNFFKLIFVATFLIAALLLLASFRRLGPTKIARAIWLYIIAAYTIGPGVLVNLIFKNNWGRARPASIEQFGGDALFTPPLLLADQCANNCSFVSGETSTIATLSLLFCTLLWANASRRAKTTMLALAIVLTASASLVRIAMGRHFFSDTIFSALFCAMIILALYQLLKIDKLRAQFTLKSLRSDLKRALSLSRSG